MARLLGGQAPAETEVPLPRIARQALAHSMWRTGAPVAAAPPPPPAPSGGQRPAWLTLANPFAALAEGTDEEDENSDEEAWEAEAVSETARFGSRSVSIGTALAASKLHALEPVAGATLATREPLVQYVKQAVEMPNIVAQESVHAGAEQKTSIGDNKMACDTDHTHMPNIHKLQAPELEVVPPVEALRDGAGDREIDMDGPEQCECEAIKVEHIKAQDKQCDDIQVEHVAAQVAPILAGGSADAKEDLLELMRDLGREDFIKFMKLKAREQRGEFLDAQDYCEVIRLERKGKLL